MQADQDANTALKNGYFPFTPRLLNASHAALYLGLSRSNFLARVATHELPQPRRIGQRTLWDRHVLDLYADALFGLAEAPAETEVEEAIEW